MIRSLRPGRLLRLGRGPYLSRLSARSFPPLSRAHYGTSSTARRPLTLNEYKFVCNYTDLADSPVSIKNRSPDAWVPFLVSCLKSPEETQKSTNPISPTGTITQYAKDLDRGHALMSYLWLAKNMRDMDLLVHLGFQLKQWPTVHALLNELIDTYEILSPFMGLKNPAPDLEWSLGDPSLSLDVISFQELPNSSLEQIQLPASKANLNITTRRPAVENFGERILGSVLLNLGTLVLSAADQSASESKLAMSCVFRTLARLHHLGLISDNVYQYRPADLDQISFRPPGLNLLSSHIMTVLSDAAWLEHEATLANTATEAGEEPPFLPFNVGFRELGPEIWLELILWCCVEHGFSKQGASLLSDMGKRTGDQAWKAASWAPLIRSLDTVRQTDISTEESWRHPDEKTPPRVFKGRERPPFNGLGRRTISTEVIASLRDMLHNKAFNSVGSSGISSSELLNLTAPLTRLLEPAMEKDELRLTNRTTNWEFNRMLGSGGIIPEEDPIAFQKVLQTTQNVVPPWGGDFIPTDMRLDGLTKAQIYDETAAMVGLAQHNIRVSAHRKQAATAFSGYARLQSIIDASKSYKIRAFFQKFNQSENANSPFFESRHLDPNLGQSALPQVQNVVMAELLDLVTTCRAFDFGNWLLFSNDIDGPSITQASYGDQAIAPSILRFAAATQNKDLSDEVIASLGPPLTTNTLRAVVCLHMSMESWDRAQFTLKFMRDYRAKSWGFSNITALASKIIRLDASIQRKLASGFQEATKEQESLAKASDLLVRLFQGKYSTPPSKSERVNDFQRLVLKRLSTLFDALPGPLSHILKQADTTFASPRDKIISIPINAFHDLLSAVVDTYGSKAGKKLFDEWCLDLPTPAQIRTKSGGVVRLKTAAERKYYEESGERSFNAKWHDYSQTKLVIPDVNTFRILAQAAYREFELDEAQNRTTQASTTNMPSFRPASASQISPLATPSTPPTPSKLNDPQYSAYNHKPNSTAVPPATESEALLDLCVIKFLQEHMEASSIEMELPGYMARMRFRGILGNESFSPPSRVKQVQDEPWMVSFLADEDKGLKTYWSNHHSRGHRGPLSPEMAPPTQIRQHDPQNEPQPNPTKPNPDEADSLKTTTPATNEDSFAQAESAKAKSVTPVESTTYVKLAMEAESAEAKPVTPVESVTYVRLAMEAESSKPTTHTTNEGDSSAQTEFTQANPESAVYVKLAMPAAPMKPGEAKSDKNKPT